ncbi:serine/threonine-protein kinase [Nocardiopsis sp. CC223A]|uniref:serine/threonine protein kinase n=1 Tax=Nocardiopsis sp. CC223A TaxID=3044051 RepID=UPI0027962076|nr:serine/threonine-protein kinase [Nocardiopsis sp. CC223A]
MFALSDNDPGRLGRYRLLASLGEGGMGHVYLAAGPGRQLLAVKRVLPHLARDAGFRQRFALEVESARRVESPHTVRLIDADTEAEQPWLASEFIPGPTLMEHIEQDGPLPEPLVRGLGADLAAALAAIHGAGLVHRDLKPSNVILTFTGAKLLDFGISRAIDYSTSVALTQTGGVVGSPGYMSPEQAQSHPLTERSDVFSLGCLLAVAATGRAPFDAPSIPQVLYKVVYEQPDLGAVPESLRDTVGRCLAKDPQDRPSAEELAGLLTGTGAVPQQTLASVAAFIHRQHAEVNAFASAVAQQPTLVDEAPTEVRPQQTPQQTPQLGPDGPVPGGPVQSGPGGAQPGGTVPPQRRVGKPALIAGAAAAALLLAVPIGYAFSSSSDAPNGGNDDPASASQTDGGGSEPEDPEAPTLSLPPSMELCNIFDPEDLIDLLGSEWTVRGLEESEERYSRCSISLDGPSISSVTLSISVLHTEADRGSICVFIDDCDYTYGSEPIPNGESTARPWEVGGLVESIFGPEMVWYEDGVSGSVLVGFIAFDDYSEEDLHAFLLERGIELYDLASES